MTAAARALHRAGIRPHLRRRELGLLLVVGAGLTVGWASYVSFRDGRLELADTGILATYLTALAVIHILFVMTGRRMDEVLFPAASLLAGISLLMMQRLPQDLVVQQVAGNELGLGELQLVWILAGFALLAATAILVRSDGWLRRYKYTWAAIGIALLMLVFLFGEVTSGARLTLRIGPFAGEPSELLKVILVVFLSGYLARPSPAGGQQHAHRAAQAAAPAIPAADAGHVEPGAADRDRPEGPRRGTPVLPRLPCASVRCHPGISYVVMGMLLFFAGGALLYQLFPHVQERVDIWINPFADAQGVGYQIIRALYAYGRGGILGTGIGAGLPQVGSVPSIPAIHTDFIFAAVAEELGMLGALGLLGLYVVIAQRGFRIAALAADDFRALLATGLTLSSWSRRRSSPARTCASSHSPASPCRWSATAARRCWSTVP